MQLSHYIDTQDLIAFAFFIVCWVAYAGFADKSKSGRDSLLAVTNRYRKEWMREMIRRDNRSVDAIMIGNLQRSITFFANTSILILFGLITMLGYHEKMSLLLTDIPFGKVSTQFMWEMKIFLLIIIFIYAFFKYTWSLRQYNYAGIFVMAVPSHTEAMTQSESIAARGSYLIGNAARHFNHGLRAYYFGLATLAWFVHPYLFMGATALIVFITHRREYHSHTLKNLAH